MLTVIRKEENTEGHQEHFRRHGSLAFRNLCWPDKCNDDKIMIKIAMIIMRNIPKDKSCIVLLLHTEFRAGVFEFLREKSSSRLSQQLEARPNYSQNIKRCR